MITVDSTDLKILAELVENSNATFVSIGKKLHLHPNVVAYRVNRMEQAGIIKEYTAVLDLEKLGLSEQVCLGANFSSHQERDEVLKQISSIPETIKVFSSLGSPESIVFLAAKNKDDVEKAISKLRSLNIKVEYTASIIKTYSEGQLGNMLKTLAKQTEIYENSRNKGVHYALGMRVNNERNKDSG